MRERLCPDCQGLTYCIDYAAAKGRQNLAKLIIDEQRLLGRDKLCPEYEAIQMEAGIKSIEVQKPDAQTYPIIVYEAPTYYKLKSHDPTDQAGQDYVKVPSSSAFISKNGKKTEVKFDPNVNYEPSLDPLITAGALKLVQNKRIHPIFEEALEVRSQHPLNLTEKQRVQWLEELSVIFKIHECTEVEKALLLAYLIKVERLSGADKRNVDAHD